MATIAPPPPRAAAPRSSGVPPRIPGAGSPGWLGDAIVCLLLAAVTFSPALSLVNAAWVPDLDLTLLLTAVAMLFGLAFARAPLPALLLHPVGIGMGLALAVWSVASTLRGETGADRLTLLAERLADWFEVVRVGGVATDNLLFLLLLAALAWVVGYLGAYTVFRYDTPWWAIVAPGAALLVNASYAGKTDRYLYIYLVASLTLIAALNARSQARSWRRAGLRYDAGLPIAFLATGLVASAMLLGASFAMPTSISAKAVMDGLGGLNEAGAQPIAEAQNELGRLFGGVSGGTVRTRDARAGFADSLTLQGEFRLSPAPVLGIEAARGRYWRAVTYQEYTGIGWRAGDNARARLDADESHATLYDARVDLVQRVSVLASRGDSVIAAAQPVSVSVPVTVEYPDDAAINPISADLWTTMRSPRVAPDGATYTVVSSISTAGEAQLRQTSADYPTEIVERYGLKPDVPERVRTLAGQLAPPQATPYEKARNVEQYLRGLTYSLSVPIPPPGRDGVDYFLFDSKTGYCDYFASAMVVLLRSSGVPARVASGYAVGEPGPTPGSWLVRDANSHSWVEVFFPEYGWIEFEPSPNRPLPERREQPTGSSAQATPTPEPVTPEQQAATAGGSIAPTATPQAGSAEGSISRLLPSIPVIPILLILIGLAALYAAARFAWGWGIDGLPAGEVGYARMARLAHLLGYGPRPEQTPREFAARLAAMMPAAARQIEALTGAFVESRFAAARNLAPEHIGALDAAWREVRRALISRRLARS